MRPKYASLEACRKTYHHLQKQFIDYLELKDEEEKVEVCEQIVDALKHTWHSDDGYTIAKRLDDDHFIEGSEALVDICSSVPSCLRKYHQDEVAKWVQEESIKPKFAVGDTVKFHKEDRKIAKIDEVHAQYYIAFNDGSTRCNVVNYEEVEPKEEK